MHYLWIRDTVSGVVKTGRGRPAGRDPRGAPSARPNRLEVVLIIVTGANGKLGRAVAERLLERVPAEQMEAHFGVWADRLVAQIPEHELIAVSEAIDGTRLVVEEDRNRTEKEES